LALWGLLLLSVTQIIIGVMLYGAISAWLEAQVNGNLLLTAAQVASVLYDSEDVGNSLDIVDVQLQLAGTNFATESFLRDQLFFVRLIDLSNGTVLASSAEYNLPALDARGDEAYFETVVFDNLDVTTEIRLYILPLSYAPRFALQTGVSLAATREIQRAVGGILAALVLFISLLAPLSGWFLANRALVPVRAITRTAAAINETDLTRRLDLAASEIELEQLVLTFNTMLDRIERAFRRERQFTADAAHELRTPLSIMQTGLEVTLSQVRSIAEYHAALQSIQEEVERLSQLSGTLLMLARTDARDLPLEIQAVDLSQMLHSVVEQFAPAAEAKGIRIESSIPPSLALAADADRLIQVIFNVVDNALKYTPEGGQVKVIAHQTGHSIEIRIEDTGPGIPAEAQARIFDRFYRTDTSRNRNRGGFGLGLAIAKRMIDLHGGAIQVISEPGQGTQLVITLPLQPYVS
jgi:heavy metal sensor kinase